VSAADASSVEADSPHATKKEAAAKRIKNFFMSLDFLLLW
jgi:hypothetical protein